MRMVSSLLDKDVIDPLLIVPICGHLDVALTLLLFSSTHRRRLSEEADLL